MGILSNQVAVVTGSSRGLGFAIAQAYAEAGASVVLAARSASTLNAAIDQFKQQGHPVTGLACDAASRADIERLADLAVSTYGKIDIWVNNAGTGAPYGPTGSVPVDRFERVIGTNIQGVYYGSMAALHRFLPRRAGKLINLVGRGADGPVPFQNAYAASKIWVRSFTLALAKEYAASGIGVFAFNSGLVLTDMITDIDVMQGYKEGLNPLKTVIRLWANPPEVPARKALWLASAATNGKTGLYANVLDAKTIVGGIAREAWRVLTRRPDPIRPLKLNEIPSE
jgi:glucose 1-dehydrogenase